MSQDRSPRHVVRDIALSFIYPPIPDRNFDWQATRNGYEPGELIGHGPTPISALTDLLEQEDDAASEDPGVTAAEADDIYRGRQRGGL